MRVTDSGWDGVPPFQMGMFGVAPRGQEKNGVVYTKPWVVDLILDLAGYQAQEDLASLVAVEPAAGHGAFLIPMASRLVQSCQQHGHPILGCSGSLIAYELNGTSAADARCLTSDALVRLGVTPQDAGTLVDGWIRTGNYLTQARGLPAADFVVGNPPYVRLEDVDPAEMAAYRRAYRTMSGRADIYVAFFEAALRQLKPKGVCAFICADRWMLNQYGAELRRLVTTAYGVEAVVELHQADPFESDVSAYPAITVIRRDKQQPAVVASADADVASTDAGVLTSSLHATRLGLAQEAVPKGLRATRVRTWFRGDDPWPLVSPEQLSLLKRLEDRFDPLESVGTGTKVGIGVATGLDDVFITTDPNLVEESRLLPLAMAADTFDGSFRWSGHYLVNPWTTGGLVDLATFPQLASYLALHQERLRRRHVAMRAPGHWYRTIDRVNPALTTKLKLYIPDIKGRIHPILDTGETYPHHNLYFVRSEGWNHEVLGGLLMSAVGQFFVECYGVRMRGGYLRFQAQYLRRIRVPKPHDVEPAAAATLADAFRRRDVPLATRVACDVYGIESLPEVWTIGPR